MVKLALPVYPTCIELNLVERMQVTLSPSPPTPPFFERPTVSWSSRRTLAEHFFWWLSPAPDSSRLSCTLGLLCLTALCLPQVVR